MKTRKLILYVYTGEHSFLFHFANFLFFFPFSLGSDGVQKGGSMFCKHPMFYWMKQVANADVDLLTIYMYGISISTMTRLKNQI